VPLEPRRLRRDAVGRTHERELVDRDVARDASSPTESSGWPRRSCDR
jgi:hypothetical protein